MHQLYLKCTVYLNLSDSICVSQILAGKSVVVAASVSSMLWYVGSTLIVAIWFVYTVE